LNPGEAVVVAAAAQADLLRPSALVVVAAAAVHIILPK
jgi:hypothetical protein